MSDLDGGARRAQKRLQQPNLRRPIQASKPADQPECPPVQLHAVGNRVPCLIFPLCRKKSCIVARRQRYRPGNDSRATFPGPAAAGRTTYIASTAIKTAGPARLCPERKLMSRWRPSTPGSPSAHQGIARVTLPPLHELEPAPRRKGFRSAPRGWPGPADAASPVFHVGAAKLWRAWMDFAASQPRLVLRARDEHDWRTCSRSWHVTARDSQPDVRLSRVAQPLTLL